ncbi:MAG: hypothetical protein PHN68_04695 [Prolixibacteraceae bacterium]|jgi:hypothetical protein|nr:hypothetical protein [Prolixibacteraceae bacterium]MDD4754671.1 hypothetical protein [Prolixibacteraceae bacterium]NLO00864.1 hypothetical protein [Bacteroidales bacterium]
MTAAVLIKYLQQIHPDTKIVVRGYEDGYNDNLKLRKVRIKYYPDAEWYYGVYSDSKDTDSMDAVDLYGENVNEKKYRKLNLSN